MSLIKKHKDMNWEGWADIPEEEVFNDWIQKRITKGKGKNYPSEMAMNRIKPHVNRLYNEYGVDANDSFYYAETAAWDSIKVSWVLKAQAADFDGFSGKTDVTPINVYKRD